MSPSESLALKRVDIVMAAVDDAFTVALGIVTTGAWLTGPLMCRLAKLLDNDPSLAEICRSSELPATGTYVTCDNCAADTEKLTPSACSTPFR